jgi:hypothetical protein
VHPGAREMEYYDLIDIVLGMAELTAAARLGRGD